jgi:hypothetical protein
LYVLHLSHPVKMQNEKVVDMEKDIEVSGDKRAKGKG